MLTQSKISHVNGPLGPILATKTVTPQWGANIDIAQENLASKEGTASHSKTLILSL